MEDNATYIAVTVVRLFDGEYLDREVRLFTQHEKQDVIAYEKMMSDQGHLVIRDNAFQFPKQGVVING